jgi:hypothetical protein
MALGEKMRQTGGSLVVVRRGLDKDKGASVQYTELMELDLSHNSMGESGLEKLCGCLACVTTLQVYSVYLLYWYKRTNTDTFFKKKWSFCVALWLVSRRCSLSMFHTMLFVTTIRAILRPRASTGSPLMYAVFCWYYNISL